MILVTGATGRTGGAVVDRLVEEGHQVRALARRPGARPWPDGVEAVAGDLTDPESIAPALDGVDRVFLLWPSGQDATIGQIVAMTADRGLPVVYLSMTGVLDDPDEADDPITESHSRLEQEARASGVPWTFIRSGGMASNTLGWAEAVRRESTVREAFGGIPRALVHERDLADVAVLGLTTDDHYNQAYEVNGPAVVTGAQQVQAIGAAVGRKITLESLDRAEAIADLRADGVDEEMAAGFVAAWEQMAAGDGEQPTGEYTRLTGRPGRSFEQWAVDHRDEFR